MMIDVIKTGLNINKKIIDKNFSIKEISEYMGFSSTRSVYKWINGVTLPSIDSFLLLSDLLETTIDELIIRG